MKRVHILCKILLAAAIGGFSLWYQHPAYNLIACSLLLLLLRLENLPVFRFPRQGRWFALLLLFMFLFRAVNGYGKVLLRLPFGWVLTDQGIAGALLFVSQIVLVFLLSTTVVLSTGLDSFRYYLQRLRRDKNGPQGLFYRGGRILLVVMLMLPECIQLRNRHALDAAGRQASARTLSARLHYLPDMLFGFLESVMQLSPRIFSDIVVQEATPLAAPGYTTAVNHLLLVLAVLTAHLFILWLNG